MNRRHKNKNKQNKLPNPTPPQKTEPPIEETAVLSDPKTDVRVPEIVSGDVQNVPVEVNIVPEPETPRKPKRNRPGKNKNLERRDDITEAEINPEVVIETEPKKKTDDIAKPEQMLENEMLIKEEIKIGDSEPVAPTARKKKGKNKKKDPSIQGEKIEIVDNPKELSSNIDYIAIDIVKPNEPQETVPISETKEQEVTGSKKKNKNKKNHKNRIDSETSEPAMECITEELVKEALHSDGTTDTDIQLEIKNKPSQEDYQQIVDINIINEEISSISLQTETKKNDNSKNKKKNKKKRSDSEKSETVTEIQLDEVIMKPDEVVAKCDTISSEMCKNIPIADAIPKPVEYEIIKVETGDVEDKPTITKDVEAKVNPIMLKLEEFKESPKEDSHKIKKKNKKDKKQIPDLPIADSDKTKSSTVKDLAEDVQSKHKYEETTESKRDIIIETLDELKDESNITDQIPENKLKTEIESSSCDIELDNLKTNENILSDKMPDSIEYPRSISEQTFVDTNNNTIISEINVEPQTLSVPIVIPETPLITGAGVTLDKSPISIDTEFKVTAMDKSATASRNVMEKTDLKSKVMEVNQDMEELRLSIEKSLAELTALEKSEELPELISVEGIVQDKLNPTFTETVSSKIPELPLKFDITTQERKENKDFDQNIRELLNKPNIEETTDTATSSGFVIANENVSTPLMDTPSPPPKKDKGKGKSKKKSKQDAEHQQTPIITTVSNVQTTDSNKTETTVKDDKKVTKQEKANESDKTKQQSNTVEESKNDVENKINESNINDSSTQEYNPIENFEDAMTSSVDDVNKSFEVIANALNYGDNIQQIGIPIENPEISITPPQKDKEKDEPGNDGQKEKPVISHPKNLLGHPDIPVQSNKIDYKKEKNKTPNTKHARVKIKDATDVEINDKAKKHSKESQTENKPRILKDRDVKDYVLNSPYDNEEYVYKYSFRKVFLSNCCHVCKKTMRDIRIPCSFCNLTFYCCQKHKDDDYAQHQALCFAVSTIIHLKGLKHIYADAKDVIGQSYRLLRMQMIVSCEKILKRRLLPWEQEALLYPRICAEPSCREWRQNTLRDCDGCGQISYCKDAPEHMPKSHQRWCKSYSLYQKLVVHQQTNGRLEPKLPTKVINSRDFQIPAKINELLAVMFEERIDMDELQYATLTQLGTAPLTAAYCHQVCNNKLNNKSLFTLHVVGAELQFEADALHKWEIFFLHLKPEVRELKVVLIGPELNPSNLPLDLLAKIKLCENCRQNKRKVVFSFHDRELYHEFSKSDDFTLPDLVCAFNSSLNRGIGYKGIDSWPATINSILKLRTPFCITSYTPNELPKDLARIRECANLPFKVMSESSQNPYASFRPDRNFITDDEMPLLFKNYCFMIIRGS